MAFEAGTDRLTCPACGTEHVAKWERMPVREWQLHQCQDCSRVLVSGASVKDYVSVMRATD